MDLIGPLPETNRGNKYILTLIDYYTNWPEAFPLAEKTAAAVAEALFENVYCRMLAPVRILSDCGREFVNEVCFLDLLSSTSYTLIYLR